MWEVSGEGEGAMQHGDIKLLCLFITSEKSDEHTMFWEVCICVFFLFGKACQKGAKSHIWDNSEQREGEKWVRSQIQKELESDTEGTVKALAARNL